MYKILSEAKKNALKVTFLYQSRHHRSSRPEVFLRKGALIMCRKFTEEHPCGSVFSHSSDNYNKHFFVMQRRVNTSHPFSFLSMR